MSGIDNSREVQRAVNEVLGRGVDIQSRINCAVESIMCYKKTEDVIIGLIESLRYIADDMERE